MADFLALTFDDGPDPIWTPRVLDALERARTRATFFMVGERVRAHPATARAVLDAGHDVQLHCDRHVRHTELDVREVEHDTLSALRSLGALGARPSRWRTPWGVSTNATAEVALRNGLGLVHWTIDTHDWRGEHPQRMLAAASNGSCGGIVLMHDALGPGSRRSGCENTIALIGELTGRARGAGLEVGSLACSREQGAGD